MCMCVILFYSFIYLQTLRLFSFLGYCNECCNKHEYVLSFKCAANILLRLFALFFIRVIILSGSFLIVFLSDSVIRIILVLWVLQNSLLFSFLEAFEKDLYVFDKNLSGKPSVPRHFFLVYFWLLIHNSSVQIFSFFMIQSQKVVYF